MNILCITHVDFETPGVIQDWAQERGYQFTICRPYKGEICSIKNFDFLIVMGGPQSPFEIDRFPYLQSEIDCIIDTIKDNKPVLGFCLGAQLIGEALGGTTERSPEKEVGVFPITLNKEGEKDSLFAGFPKTFPVINWHNDMPGLTKDSVVLAASEGCPRQVLRYQSNVYGFQCHLEITLPGIIDLMEACTGDLKPSLFTQTKEQLLENDYQTIHDMMFVVLDRLASMEKINKVTPYSTDQQSRDTCHPSL